MASPARGPVHLERTSLGWYNPRPGQAGPLPAIWLGRAARHALPPLQPAGGGGGSPAVAGEPAVLLARYLSWFAAGLFPHWSPAPRRPSQTSSAGIEGRGAAALAASDCSSATGRQRRGGERPRPATSLAGGAHWPCRNQMNTQTICLGHGWSGQSLQFTVAGGVDLLRPVFMCFLSAVSSLPRVFGDLLCCLCFSLSRVFEDLLCCLCISPSLVFAEAVG